jgi:hypothetical protein
MRKSSPYRRLAGLALAFALALPGVEAGAACLSAAESRQAVASGQAMTLSQALQRAGISGTPVNVALCTGGRGYIYQVSVREPNGTLRTVTIPAS